MRNTLKLIKHLTLLETLVHRQTDRQTDIVRYRAAIAAKNAVNSGHLVP